MTIARQLLSGSTNGRGVKVAATATPGTLIHTAHATSLDEVWLWCVNSDSAACKLTVEFGGTTSPDDLIEVSIPLEDINAQGTTILMVTHDPELAARAQRNVHIIDGQVSDLMRETAATLAAVAATI